jgi:predicted nucleic acid-binding protein
VDVAIAANADYLVTNDRHFEVLRQLEFPRVPVVSRQEFLSSF